MRRAPEGRFVPRGSTQRKQKRLPPHRRKEPYSVSAIIRGYAGDRRRQGTRFACRRSKSVARRIRGEDLFRRSLPAQRPATKPPAARKSIGHALRVQVPMSPMGCRPSPVTGIVPPNPGFVNEQTVNSKTSVPGASEIGLLRKPNRNQSTFPHVKG